ncbi:hypothetical protein R5W24_003378 [Gemmata sp. JC717]|uniref:carboxypeptidase-like regulatory domain-containing protein n=1 Tax=Gemmata algarum TaxID=2975278 RepID=UPI0021BAA046|nr:carboxypeptidase-like regulatory domain-containing protein [Gemmata algarum]MDY3554259.1 hypothetical protein [Gemmata algarum]
MRGAAVLTLVCFLFSGCGSSEPKKYRVAGTVKYKGEPLKAGTVTFRSPDRAHSAVGTIAEGRYDIPAVSGLPAGQYQVTVCSPDPKAPVRPADEGPGDYSNPAKEYLPAKYNTHTELSAEIKAEAGNEISFDLK